MIRKKTGFKELTILVLASAALVSVACGDDDDNTPPGTAGSAGTSAGSAGKSGGGSAGKGGGGSSNGGANDGGTTTGGTTTAGTAGTGAGGTGGTGGTDNQGGEAGVGGVPMEGGSGGQGGEPVVGGAGGAGGEGGAPEVVFDTLRNPGFEQPLLPTGSQPPDSKTTTFPEWSNQSTPAGASYIQWGNIVNNEQHGGSVRLAQYSDNAYVATLEQEVSPIANGTYSFSVWVTRANAEALNESFLYAVGHNADMPDQEVTINTDSAIGSTWVKVTLADIVVTSGKLTVGVQTDADAGGWINFDDAELTRIPE